MKACKDCSACARVTGQAKLSSRPGCAAKRALTSAITSRVTASGSKRRARRHGARAGGAEGLAVVGVEVPLAADGLVVAASARHAACAARGRSTPCAGDLRPLACAANSRTLHEEVAVLADVQRQAVGLGHGLDRLQHAPVARRGHHQPGRPQALDVGLQLRRQAAARCRAHPAACSAAGGRRLAGPARSGASPPGTSPCAACSTTHGSTPRPPRPSRRRRARHRSRRTPRRRGRAGRPARRSGRAAQPRAAFAAPAGVGAVLHVGPVLRPAAAPAHRPGRRPTQGLLGNAALLPRKRALLRVIVDARTGSVRRLRPSWPRRCTSPGRPPAGRADAGVRSACQPALMQGKTREALESRAAGT